MRADSNGFDLLAVGRWLAAPVAVVGTLVLFGFAGAGLADALASGAADRAGGCAAAFGAVVSAFLVVPRHKLAFSAVVFVAGAWLAVRELTPDPELSDRPATYAELSWTLAGGLVALAVCALASRGRDSG